LLCGVETVLGGVFIAGDGGEGKRRQWMADEFGVDSAGAVELGFKGEDYEHLRNVLLDPPQAAAFPRPKLWAYEPKNWNAEAAEVHCEAEVDVGEVDEDGEGGPVMLDRGDECAILRVDIRRVADHFREAHVGDVFGADDAVLASGLHRGTTEAGEGGQRNTGAEFRDDLGSVMVARGFAGGEKNAWVGSDIDVSKFSSQERQRRDIGSEFRIYHQIRRECVKVGERFKNE